MPIALVTDSTAQLPAELRDRYRIRVVPMTVSLDGLPHKEGVDLDAPAFYERLAQGPEVTTSAPAPGEIVAAYENAVRAGAEAILSVHVGSNLSGTLNAVRVAAETCPVPVHTVDTATASFAQGLCVWEAAEHLDRGSSLDEAADAARTTAQTLGDVFVVGVPELARAGGRLDVDLRTDRLSVITFAGGLEEVASANAPQEAIAEMTRYIESWADDRPLRVGVGDGVATQAADELADRLRQISVTKELVRYTVGPSVGAHTGPGTFGAVFAPVC